MVLNNNEKIYFIADLHLCEDQPQIVQIFLNFLKRVPHEAKALYILGDFFEFWIGDDDLSDFHLKIIKALHEVTKKGFPIYFMHGNRDFLVGEPFAKLSGCTLLADEVVVDCFGEKILLLHGDTLCTHDARYLRARKWLRYRGIQWLFLCLPLNLRRRIALKMRSNSKRYTSQIPLEMMDVAESAVKDVLAKHQMNLLIHGHTHRSMISLSRIVLAAWHEVGNVLVVDSEGRKEFMWMSG